MLRDYGSTSSTSDNQLSEYVITLTQNYNFHTIDRDLEALYENFSLISYLSKRCQVTILDRYILDGSEVDEFETGLLIKQNPLPVFLLHMKHKQAIPKKTTYMKAIQPKILKDLKIQYILTDKSTSQKLSEIYVQFKTELRNAVEYIHIHIADSQRWLGRIFDVHQLYNRFDRLNDHRFQKKNQLQYYYVQPQSQRHKIIPNKHIALALQGGGVKGICYIGAIKAIRQEFQNIKITSVIGSSAGGILALSICCELSEQQIINLCIQDLSKVTSSDQKYKNGPALQKYIFEQKYYKRILGTFLVDFGIIDQKLFQIMVESIQSEEIQEAVIELIEALNPSIRDLLTVPKSKQKRRLLLYGLLQGKMMTGETVKQIAIKSLLLFRRKNNIKIPQKYGQNENAWAQKLTLKQFYNLQPIQFTCTSVDLQNHILRFFNHKTTPDLPVCMAVLMTGSFPIAFQSHKWSTSKWGKYYVHYQLTRKQIDLDGCEFTDGGMLANFPIKYLDNQKMRPMYFSHETSYRSRGSTDSSQSETLLYGFGLNDIKVMPPSQTKIIKDKLSKLGKLILENVNRRKVVGNFIVRLFTSPSKQTNLQLQNKKNSIYNIPLFQTLSKLLHTYSKTKDNLTKQCFATDICSNFIPETLINMQEGTVKSKITFSQAVQKLLKNFRRIIMVQINRKQIPINNLIYNLHYIQQYLSRTSYLEDNILFIELTINHLVTTYLHFSDSEDVKKVPKLLKFHEYLHKKSIEFHQEMTHSSIFLNSFIKQDYQKLRNLIEKDLIPFFEEIQSELKKSKNKKISEDALIVEHTLSKIKKYEQFNYNELQKSLVCFQDEVEKIISRKQDQIIVMDEQLMFRIFEIKKNFLTCVKFRDLKQFIDQGILESQIQQLVIGYSNYEKKRQILGYLKKIITKQYLRNKTLGLHLVLQSRKLSEIYFHQLMGFMKIAINQLNTEFKLRQNSQLFIQSMTGSDFHSVILFLHSSDFSNKKIGQQVWKIKDLIQTNPKIEKQFNSNSWAQNNLLRIKQLQKQIWNNRYDIFKEIQTKIRQIILKTEDQFQAFFKDRFEDGRNFIDEVNENLQTSLNYVIDAIYNLEQKENIEKKIQQISQKLSLDLNDKGKQTLSQFQQLSKQTSALCAFFSEKFLGIVKYLLYQSHENVIFHLKEKERKEAWKGLIMGQALSGMKLKRYILEKLEQLGLKANTTLKEFYDLSRKKIHLNFTAIESSSNAITFLNHKTSPYMPVWAAILATSSHPLLFKPVINRAQWDYLPIEKFSQRIVRKYFSTDTFNKNFQSADLLMKIPFQLVTNHRIKQLITNHRDEIYLGFNFLVMRNNGKKQQMDIIEKVKVNRKDKLMQSITNKPITIYDLIFNLNFSFAAFELLLTIPALAYRLNLLSLFVNSHDNLITQIYRKQLTKIPVRLGTLDFSEITDINGRMTDIFKDTVMQAFYVSLQNIKNSISSGEVKKIIYIRVENSRKKQKKKKNTTQYFSPGSILLTHLSNPVTGKHKSSKNQQQYKLDGKNTNIDEQSQDFVIRFLTFHETARSILEKSKIFYRFSDKKNYKQLTNQYLSIKFETKKTIIFKIVYPEIITGDQLLSSNSIRRLEYEAQFQKNSSIQKTIKYFQLNFDDLQQQIDLQASKNRAYMNYGFVYCLQYNKFTEMKPLLPVQGEINNKNLENLKPFSLNIRSLTRQDIVSDDTKYCDFCNKSCQASFKSIKHRNHKIMKVSCDQKSHIHHQKASKSQKCAHCQVPNRYIVLRCQCLAEYCIQCKYRPVVKSNQLQCPLNHVLNKVKKEDLIRMMKQSAINEQFEQIKSQMQESQTQLLRQFSNQQKNQKLSPIPYLSEKQTELAKKQSSRIISQNFNSNYSMCDLCENISCQDFYYDSQCRVLICQVCCLKIFSTK